MTTHAANIAPQSTMRDVLEAYPGAQRALFKRYHIGGCSSCAFHPEETVVQLCERNGNISVEELLEHLKTSYDQDEQMLISPGELSDLLQKDESLKLLDVRTRQEWDAVRIDGAVRMSQDTMQEILGKWPREQLIVIYDHTGKQSLDAAAYFQGQGFKNVRCLRGGIDAWAQEIDPKLPRYRLE